MAKNKQIEETQAAIVESQGQTGEGEGKVKETRPKNAEGDFSKKATELLKAFDRSIIFRCPKTGQWFTNEDFAKEYESKNKIKLEIYKNE